MGTALRSLAVETLHFLSGKLLACPYHSFTLQWLRLSPENRGKLLTQAHLHFSVLIHRCTENEQKDDMLIYFEYINQTLK